MPEPAATLCGLTAITHRRNTLKPQSPAALAQLLDPRFRVTPTIKLLDRVAVRSITEPNQRDIVNTPPRTGKSQLLAVWTIVWALMRNPDFQVIMTAHTDDLAQEFSRKARQIIREHSDYLGYRIAVDKTASGRWTVESRHEQPDGTVRWAKRQGGVLATGIQSGIVGMGADAVLIDDPLKSMEEADSVAHRRRVMSAYTSVIAPRLHPGGSLLLVMTRWHDLDLAGALLAAEPARWRHTNIPAVADGVTEDALGRPVGQVMVSALGYTPEDYAQMRASLGVRVWSAQYQGNPTPLAGGLVQREWLDAWRLPIAPPNPVRTIVSVDPSDSGSGDACGIVATSLTADGVVAVVADVSAPMTSDQWARAAVGLADGVGASEIVVEGFAARETYMRVVREALGRANLGRAVRVSAWPPKGRTRVGDAVARSSSLIQDLEVGRCRVAGQLPGLEDAMVGWQSGQHQPDSMAALVIGHDTLVSTVSAGMGLSGVPGDVSAAGVTSIDWLRRPRAAG